MLPASLAGSLQAAAALPDLVMALAPRAAVALRAWAVDTRQVAAGRQVAAAVRLREVAALQAWEAHRRATAAGRRKDSAQSQEEAAS